jgi:hypothetical protein
MTTASSTTQASKRASPTCSSTSRPRRTCLSPPAPTRRCRSRGFARGELVEIWAAPHARAPHARVQAGRVLWEDAIGAQLPETRNVPATAPGKAESFSLRRARLRGRPQRRGRPAEQRDASADFEGPIGVGTRFRTEVKTIGRAVPTVVEFTGFERPRRVASVTRASMMETEGALRFESVPMARGCVGRETSGHAAR